MTAMTKRTLISLALTASIFLFYFLTSARSVTWGDSAKLAIYVKQIDREGYHLFNLIGNHSLHIRIGKLFSYLPFRDFAFRQNLMSAFFSSLTVLVMFFASCRLTGRVFASAVASLALGVSHTFWSLAVINESYAGLAFFTAASIYLLLIWSLNQKGWALLLFLAVYLLSIFSNMFPVFFSIPFFSFIFLRSANRKRDLGILAAAVGIFATLFFVFITAYNKKNNFSYQNFINIYMNHIKWFMSGKLFLRELVKYPLYLFYQFPIVGFFAGLMGMAACLRRHRDIFWLFFASFAVNILFSSSYMMQRKFNILLLSYLIFSMWLAEGLAWLEEFLTVRHIYRVSAALFVVCLPLVFYYTAPSWAKKAGLRLDFIRVLPYRDLYRYYLLPDKHTESSAARYGREALAAAEKNAVILTDFTPGRVLLYLQIIEGLRPDIYIDEEIDGFLYSKDPAASLLRAVERFSKERPVYLADANERIYFLEAVSRKFNIVPRGPIFKIEKRVEFQKDK